MMTKESTIEPTHICPLCRWDLDTGGFYPWDSSRRRLICPRCSSDFNAGDVVFDHDLISYHYVGNNPLFTAADVFWSMRTLSEKEFFEQMASYDVSEEKASHTLRELINRRIVRKIGDKFSLQNMPNEKNDRDTERIFEALGLISPSMVMKHLGKSWRKSMRTSLSASTLQSQLDLINAPFSG